MLAALKLSAGHPHANQRSRMALNTLRSCAIASDAKRFTNMRQGEQLTNSNLDTSPLQAAAAGVNSTSIKVQVPGKPNPGLKELRLCQHAALLAHIEHPWTWANLRSFCCCAHGAPWLSMLDIYSRRRLRLAATTLRASFETQTGRAWSFDSCLLAASFCTSTKSQSECHTTAHEAEQWGQRIARPR